MSLIAGEFRLTVKQLRESLEYYPDNLIVAVHNIMPDGGYIYRSIYKIACDADEVTLFLYSGGSWPTKT